MSSAPTTPRFISDRPTMEDALGREGFAHHLADAIVNLRHEDGFVFAIEGPWGSGKSSVIEMMKDRFSKARAQAALPVVIEFNPWMASTTGALVESLITEIATKVGTSFLSDSKAIDVSEKLLNYVGLIKHIKYLSPLKYFPLTGWMGHIADDLSAAASAATEASDTAKQALTDFKESLPKINIEQRRAEIKDSLSTFNRQIIVVIDDLDRLDPDEIKIIIKATKAVADFPRVTYLLVYDHDIVATALGNGDGEKGSAYLEKIVQVSYPLPPLFRFQILSLAKSQIESCLTQMELALDKYEGVIFDDAVDMISRLCRQPRDVARLINRLWISIPSTSDQINIVDIIMMEALTQRFPSLRKSIHHHPEVFSNGNFPDDEDLFDSSRKFRQSQDSTKALNADTIVQYLPSAPDDRSIALAACKFLFSGSGRTFTYGDNRRLSLAKNLARFFSLTSLERVVPDSFIHTLLESDKALASFLSSESEGDLSQSLGWIIAQLSAAPSVKADRVLDVVIDSTNKIVSRKKIDLDLSERLANFQLELLLRTDVTARKGYFSKVLNQQAFSVAEMVIHEFLREVEKLQPPPASGESTGQDLNSIAAMRTMLTERVLAEHRTGRLQQEARLHAILKNLTFNLKSPQETIRIIKEISGTKAGLKTFLEPFKAKPFYSSQRDTLLIIGPDHIKKRIGEEQLVDSYDDLIALLEDPRFIEAAELESELVRR